MNAIRDNLKTSDSKKAVKFYSVKTNDVTQQLPLSFINSRIRKSMDIQTTKNQIEKKNLLISLEHLKEKPSKIDCFQILFKNKNMKVGSSPELKKCCNPIVIFPFPMPQVSISSNLFQKYMINQNDHFNINMNINSGSNLDSNIKEANKNEKKLFQTFSSQITKRRNSK